MPVALPLCGKFPEHAQLEKKKEKVSLPLSHGRIGCISVHLAESHRVKDAQLLVRVRVPPSAFKLLTRQLLGRGS